MFYVLNYKTWGMLQDQNQALRDVHELRKLTVDEWDKLTQGVWGIGGSVIAADCGVQSPFIRAMGGRYLRCATYVIASQYTTSIIVNRCWSGFPCKWRYINVETFNL